MVHGLNRLSVFFVKKVTFTDEIIIIFIFIVCEGSKFVNRKVSEKNQVEALITNILRI